MSTEEVKQLSKGMQNVELDGKQKTLSAEEDDQISAGEEDSVEQESKLIEKGVKGVVAWYSAQNHYGFISRQVAEDDNNKPDDIFVHATAIAKCRIPWRSLDDNEEVLFDIVKGRRGPEAANVTGPGGNAVRGSRHAYPRHPRNSNYLRNRTFRKKRPDEIVKSSDGVDSSPKEHPVQHGAGDGGADGPPAHHNKRRFRNRKGKGARKHQNDEHKDGEETDKHGDIDDVQSPVGDQANGEGETATVGDGTAGIEEH